MASYKGKRARPSRPFLFSPTVGRPSGEDQQLLAVLHKNQAIEYCGFAAIRAERLCLSAGPTLALNRGYLPRSSPRQIASISDLIPLTESQRLSARKAAKPQNGGGIFVQSHCWLSSASTSKQSGKLKAAAASGAEPINITN